MLDINVYIDISDIDLYIDISIRNKYNVDIVICTPVQCVEEMHQCVVFQ